MELLILADFGNLQNHILKESWEQCFDVWGTFYSAMQHWSNPDLATTPPDFDRCFGPGNPNTSCDVDRKRDAVPANTSAPIDDKNTQPFEAHPAKRWDTCRNLLDISGSDGAKSHCHLCSLRRSGLQSNENLKWSNLAWWTKTNLQKLQWPLARVEEVYLGRNSHCRSVKVKTATGCYIRPCIKLRKLPVSVDWTWFFQGGRHCCDLYMANISYTQILIVVDRKQYFNRGSLVIHGIVSNT